MSTRRARAFPRARLEAVSMVKRPDDVGAFAFVTLARLRVLQLAQGCTPRVAGIHTIAVMAQMEVAAGAVSAIDAPLDPMSGTVVP